MVGMTVNKLIRVDGAEIAFSEVNQHMALFDVRSSNVKYPDTVCANLSREQAVELRAALSEFIGDAPARSVVEG